VHRFRIDAILDPQSLPRIAGYFAQRAIVPSVMRMRVLRRHMRIDVTVHGLETPQAATIVAKLHEVVAVIGADFEEMAA